MKQIAINIFDFTAFRLFGVCHYVARKLGINVDKIRVYFIYSSFAMLGLPVLLYLFLSFIIELRNLTRKRKQRIWNS